MSEHLLYNIIYRHAFYCSYFLCKVYAIIYMTVSLWNWHESYPKMVGYPKDICIFIKTIGVSWLMSRYSTSQISQLGKTNGYFSPLVAYMASYSTIKPIQYWHNLRLISTSFFNILWHRCVISLVTVFYNDVLVGKKWNQY